MVTERVLAVDPEILAATQRVFWTFPIYKHSSATISDTIPEHVSAWILGELHESGVYEEGVFFWCGLVRAESIEEARKEILKLYGRLAKLLVWKDKPTDIVRDPLRSPVTTLRLGQPSVASKADHRQRAIDSALAVLLPLDGNKNGEPTRFDIMKIVREVHEILRPHPLDRGVVRSRNRRCVDAGSRPSSSDM